MKGRGPVIAIDGPSGAGKSTAGRALAERLGYSFLDTGAMYRALALKALLDKIPLDQPAPIAAVARRLDLEFTRNGGVLLDGEDVTARIRDPDVSVAASRVSAHGDVRTVMVERQREIGRDGRIVMDGRDIGTVVFPDAEVKFFLDADPRSRAQRRGLELGGGEAELPRIEKEMRERDDRDSNRQASPLTRAADAIYLDTTKLAPTETLARMIEATKRLAVSED